MKNLLLTILLGATTTAVAQPVFLNITAENSTSPAQTIPTASQDECGKLMTTLAKQENENFFMSCSIVPQTR